MKTLLKKKIVSFVILSFFFLTSFFAFTAGTASAVNLNQQEGFKSNEIQNVYGGNVVEGRSDVITIMVRVINAILGLLGIIFVILLLVAGFRYMNARGNDQEVEDALKQIRRAVIGTIIILMSWSITGFVLSKLTDETILPYI